MKKSTAITIIAALSALLVLSFVPRMVQYLVPAPEVSDTTSVSDSTAEETSEPVYHRVEAEKYELVFPETVNTSATYGNLAWSTMTRDDCHLFGSIEFSDEDCLDGDDFYLEFNVYCDGELTTQATSLYQVVAGEYGRYVISETQVVDEPVAFTLEPIYEYVLVE